MKTNGPIVRPDHTKLFILAVMKTGTIFRTVLSDSNTIQGSFLVEN